MEEKRIKLNREAKIFLLASIKSGFIDVGEMRKILGVTRPEINLQLVDTGVPLASSEDDIFENNKNLQKNGT
jgi:hypothetical protein